MKTKQLAILEDELNRMNYILWDTKYCCLTYETIDLVRSTINDLIIENRMKKEDKSVWLWEHLL